MYLRDTSLGLAAKGICPGTTMCRNYSAQWPCEPNSNARINLPRSRPFALDCTVVRAAYTFWPSLSCQTRGDVTACAHTTRVHVMSDLWTDSRGDPFRREARGASCSVHARRNSLLTCTPQNSSQRMCAHPTPAYNRRLTRQQAVGIVSFTILVWDHFLTFSSEVRLAYGDAITNANGSQVQVIWTRPKGARPGLRTPHNLLVPETSLTSPKSHLSLHPCAYLVGSLMNLRSHGL